MASCHFPTFSCSFHNLFALSSSLKVEEPHLKWDTHHNPLRRILIVACSSEKSRLSKKKLKASRPTKSNEELCNELHDFISTAGLPENHVPSIKELSEHGRKDLAYIVRRRGYKAITELLMNPIKWNKQADKNSVGNQVSSSGCNDEASEGQERKTSESAECISLSSDSSMVGQYIFSPNGAVATADSCFQVSELSDSSVEFLHAKAANFIQTGDLDTVEDSVASQQDAPLPREQHPHRDDFSSGEGMEGADFDENLVSEAGERGNQFEIDRLKAMLHQKEIELSQLKQQIENEKLALSILQAKAKTEIGNAQKVMTAKDLELRATEEILSELKEVEIEYWGNGEMVEIAGSFNGWHHRIKMDLHPSSRTLDPSGTRKSVLWTTVLWLYPGIYEIKFIVDGQWRIDPQQEMITRGNIANNILRV